jgi:hypothetical protein
MNKRLAILAIGSLLVAGALGETNVGVSIGITQPGVYGRIDIGSYPRPAVVYGQPIIIAPQPMLVRPSPVYLYVPPGHQRNWATAAVRGWQSPTWARCRLNECIRRPRTDAADPKASVALFRSSDRSAPVNDRSPNKA